MEKVPLTVDEKRRRTMSRIKCKDTSIEVSLRRALWESGIRYRKNHADLPGVPDIAITKHKIAIFCDGDFWHGRDWDTKKAKIKSNRDYWIPKIERNIVRDRENEKRLIDIGWTVQRFWGTEICSNLVACVEEIEQRLFQCKMDAWATDWEFDDL
jgi:DNA mismatch endonuclease (patch repair protein)